MLFHRQFQMLRLRLWRGHVVVCGLGGKGAHLARGLLARGHRIAAVERDEENDAVRPCQEQGAIVLLGTACDRELLRRVGALRASHVVALCESDGTNVEIAVQLYQMLHESGAARTRPLQCFVHIVDLKLCTLFEHHKVFTETGDPFEARVFNIYQAGARLLFRDHPLDRGLIAADDPRGAHLVIVGFGQMGESVAVQAARIGHFANGRKLRITIVDTAAEERRAKFLRRYPQFHHVCEAAFVGGDVEDPARLARVAAWGRDADAVTTIAVCFDDDSRSLSCALELLSELGRCEVPILVRMSEEAGLAKLFEGASSSVEWASRVHAFGMLERVCTPEVLLNEELDRLARAIHRNYVERRRREHAPETDESLRPWAQLDEALKSSNRQQADHIPVKLRAIRCVSARPEAGREALAAFTDQEVETLARMEHARWNADRFLGGWTRGARDSARKQSPYLVGWEELPEEIREYDREAVRQVPELLALVGERVYRVTDYMARHDSESIPHV